MNLERALAVGDRLGGHIVQGHVDAVAEVTARRKDRRTPWWWTSRSRPQLGALVVPHGSIAVDGVSLTVNAIPDAHDGSAFPHRLHAEATTLGALRVGHRVQVEADILGKYVQRLAAPHLAVAAE